MTHPVRVSMLLMVSETVLLFSCYSLAAYWTTALNMDLYLIYDSGLLQIGSVVAVIQMGLYFQLLYDDPIPRSKVVLIQQLSLVLGVAFLLQSLFSFIDVMVQLPKWAMVLGSLLVVVVLPLWRMIYAALMSQAIPVRKLLFLGASPMSSEIAANLAAHPNLRITALGYLDQELRSSSSLAHLGRLEDLDEVVRVNKPDYIVSALNTPHSPLSARSLLNLQLAGVQLEDEAELHQTLTRRLSATETNPDQIIFSSALPTTRPMVLFQLLIRFLGGGVSAVITSPLFLLISVLLSFSGPVFARSQRVGLNGRIFTLYRFRLHPATRLGRLLRRFECLPMLFNFIRGDLALVGPRPHIPEFAAVLSQQLPLYKQRQCVKPGLTGWAQVNGQSPVDAIRSLEYDLYYEKHMSVALDTYILIHSVI